MPALWPEENLIVSVLMPSVYTVGARSIIRLTFRR
jgi:hypothetical protein